MVDAWVTSAALPYVLSGNHWWHSALNGSTPLSTSAKKYLAVAALKGLAETVRALVEAGAKVDHADAMGFAALFGAAVTGHVETIGALLKAGAAVNHAAHEGYVRRTNRTKFNHT
jgi:ankyrin repeat protein